MQDELLDLVDKNDNVIGTVWKSNAHGNPNLIHREVAITIFFKDEILLQQRSFMKKVGAGKWETTAAGHALAGEDPKKAAEREVFEELGFKTNLKYFKKIFAQHIDNEHNRSESRFFYVFYSILNKKPSLILDKQEVENARWVTLTKLEKFSKTNNYKIDGLSHKTIMEIAKMLKII